MDYKLVGIIERLEADRTLSDNQLLELIAGMKKADKDTEEMLYHRADAVRQKLYGRDVYIRGLIEFSNYCKNDCYYCGIRRSNQCADRYRLNQEQIMDCCQIGHKLGFRTFVLQSGEDSFYTDEKICDIVSTIKNEYPDCAVTLSIGEKSYESYKAYFDAGADRYLLRHETADYEHYSRLHPSELSARNRQQCLRNLKNIGFQVGCGIMVGSPWQTDEHILKDLRFMQELRPHMIGIGPFIPHKYTPFREKEAGTLKDTLHLISIIRLMFPECLLPATTALGTIHSDGREMGIKAGANVVMPNLSPSEVREKYLLYDGKICTGDEAAEFRYCLDNRMKGIGYRVVVSRGDYLASV